jgi:hypothetical protein
MIARRDASTRRPGTSAALADSLPIGTMRAPEALKVRWMTWLKGHVPRAPAALCW